MRFILEIVLDLKNPALIENNLFLNMPLQFSVNDADNFFEWGITLAKIVAWLGGLLNDQGYLYVKY